MISTQEKRKKKVKNKNMENAKTVDEIWKKK